MKTNSLRKIFMLIFIASTVLISCSKESDPSQLGSGSVIGLTNTYYLGNVVDFGLINSDTRMMKMAISPQNFNLYDDMGELSRTSAHVELSFYVNEDGFIPSGEYSFVNTESKSAFTFDAGLLIPDNGNLADPIVDGSVVVNRDGENYVFSIQADLASGLKFSESYRGSMLYADSK
jgi:hypothetical protein